MEIAWSELGVPVQVPPHGTEGARKPKMKNALASETRRFILETALVRHYPPKQVR